MKTEPSSARWWDLPAASLLLVAMVTAATRLVATNWTDDLTLVQTIVFFGTVAGLALGYSRFSPRLAGIFALLYGLFVVPWQLGLTVGPRVEWSERMLSLAGRLNIIINQLVDKEIVQDSLLFLVLMGALFWLLSVHAGYTLIRYGNAWRAVLPAGLAIFAIHSFDALIARRAWYLAVYLFFSLVLIARVAYLHHHTRWQQSRAALPPHLGLDFIRFTLLATGVLVVFAWTAPALANTLPAAERAFQRIKQPWNEMRDRMDNVFASLQSSVGVVSDYYGNSVTLGRGNRLSDSQVLRVKVPEDIPAGTRLYWRARTYDRYEGQWLSTAADTQAFDPDDDELSLEDQGRWAGRFEFTTATYVTTLFSPPQPLWVSRPSQMVLQENGDGSVDISTFRATPSLEPGQVYRVQAALTNATAAQMRAAGTGYPEWVTDRYLQLPDNITDRTRQLAREITAGQPTPYDKAVAITNWLRTNITYTEIVPERPARQEAIDWFLFDHKQGFCNYYASAQVVMLRSLGIPARWSAGFAQGEKLDDGSYLVRQRDAHAWPEVFFPGLGWVEFEPTSSQPILARLPGEGDINDPNLANQANLEEMQRQALEEELALLREEERLARRDQLGTDIEAESTTKLLPLLYWSLTVLAGAVVLILAYRSREKLSERVQSMPIVVESTLIRAGIHPPKFIRRWALWASLPPLTRSYLEINGALRRLGSQPEPTETPSERAGALSKIVPPAEPPAHQLVSEYQLATFGRQADNLPPDVQAARRAGSEIRKLSYRALFQRWLSRFQQPDQKGRTAWRRTGAGK